VTRIVLLALVLASEPALAGRPTSLPAAVPLQTLAGGTASLATFAGKPLLVELWATWCEACGESLAIAADLERDLGPRGLTVVAVSIDTKAEDVERYLASHPHPTTVRRDGTGALADALALRQLPAALVVAPDGTIRAIHEGKVRGLAERLRQDLEPLLTAAPPGAARPGEPQP